MKRMREKAEFRVSVQGNLIIIDVVGLITTPVVEEGTERAARVIRQEGRKWNIITDFTHAQIGDKGANKVLSAYSKGNRPYVRKSAVLGISGLKRFFFDLVVRASGRRDLRLFKTREQALRWIDTPLTREDVVLTVDDTE